MEGRWDSDPRNTTGYRCIKLARQPALEPGTRGNGAKNDFRGHHSARHAWSPAENQLGFSKAAAGQRQKTLQTCQPQQRFERVFTT